MSIPVGTEDISRFNALESSFGQSTPINDFVVPCIVEMFANKDVTLAYHLRTGPQSLGDAAERKRFKYVEFHGVGNIGTLSVRIYIDGRYVCDGRATVSEVPSRHRKVNVPIGRQIGYTIDVEFAGNALPRAIEYTFEGMSHES